LVSYEFCTDNYDEVDVTLFISCHPSELELTWVSEVTELTYTINSETHASVVFTFSHYNCDIEVDAYNGSDKTDQIDFFNLSQDRDQVTVWVEIDDYDLATLNLVGTY
jgi:hypothetical protein